MKIYDVSRIIIGFSWIVFYSAVSFSQNKTDAYQAERDGYFTHPCVTTFGIVFTDNAASKLYLLQDGEKSVLATTPGCGRYYTVSPDKTKIGYKKINPDGMQVPAIFDLSTMKIKELTEAVDLCGQVSLGKDGKIAYTTGNDLNVIDVNGEIRKYPLGVYSNIVPISPDGNYAIYNNDSDQLFMIDLGSGQIMQITDNSQGYMYPQWSPDGNKILFSSLSGTLMVLDRISNTTIVIGTGENASWSDDSQYITYDVISSDNFDFTGSEIYLVKYDGSSVARLTNTSGTNEMFPSFADNNAIIFSTYDKQEIISVVFDQNYTAVLSADTLVRTSQSISMEKNHSDQFTQKLLKTDTKISGDAPYLHQIYDTPDWHYGSGSCAPTTAAMALAYYNRLPYWDITVSSPYSHTSHYGSYVADMYRYGEVYYNTVAQTGGGEDAWGGYGYMWGLGSPNSYMASYIQNHEVTSVHSTTTTFAEVQAEVDQSYPFSICSLLSTAGHLTLTVGYVNGQHTLIFNDPYGDKNDGSWPNYNGKDSYYDWPGYNNGYENLNTMAWTVTSESSEAVYNDTIIDDVYYNHGFNINNQGAALMRYYRDIKTGGYNNHYWWTYTSASTTTDTCYVTWTPDLPSSGDYEVFAYIPTSNASATSARYKVYYDGGNQTVIVNQAPIYGDWVSLGTFHFLAGSSGYVRLGDAAGVQSQKIAFDAMKWVNVTQPEAIASFTSPTTVCEEDSVQYTNTSTDATSYSWTFDGGTPSVSTQEDPWVTYPNAGTYDVTLVATGQGGADTLSMQNYITVDPIAHAQFTVNDTLVYLPSAFVTFTNTSLNATSYLWDFGDGSTSTDQNPWHNYSSTGYYTVTLIAYNAQCGNDTIVIDSCIHVEVSTITEPASSGTFDFSVYTDPFSGGISVYYNLSEANYIKITLCDILGNEVFSLNEDQQQGAHKVQLYKAQSHLSSGIYLIKFSSGRSLLMRKVFLQ